MNNFIKIKTIIKNLLASLFQLVSDSQLEPLLFRIFMLALYTYKFTRYWYMYMYTGPYNCCYQIKEIPGKSDAP